MGARRMASTICPLPVSVMEVRPRVPRDGLRGPRGARVGRCHAQAVHLPGPALGLKSPPPPPGGGARYIPSGTAPCATGRPAAVLETSVNLPGQDVRGVAERYAESTLFRPAAVSDAVIDLRRSNQCLDNRNAPRAMPRATEGRRCAGLPIGTGIKS